MTLPELTPEGEDSAPPEPEARLDTRRERALEGALMGLILVLAVAIGAPEVVDSLRDRSVDLGAVFYPVMVAAVAGLAWTRRTSA